MKFTRKYRVRASEISPKFLLKEYYISMYFQECFAEYAHELGVAGYHVDKLGLTWITCDGRAEFYGDMPFWNKDVNVSCWMFKITPVRMYAAYEAEYAGNVIARAESVQLMADLKTHRPQRSDAVAKYFEIENERPFPEETFPKIEMFDNGCCASEGTNVISQYVRFDDLDFNMHLNNVKYIPRALEAVDLDFRLSHKLKGYRLKYEHEARFGDGVESIVTRRGNNCTHILRRPDGGELCRMTSQWENI